MLCRTYVNIMEKKLLTAEKILGWAENLINIIEKGRDLKIITAPELR